MKIEGSTNRYLDFIDLNEGDVFIALNDDVLYMKTDSEDNECESIRVNAVALDSGRLVLFDDDDCVALIKGKFVIER